MWGGARAEASDKKEAALRTASKTHMVPSKLIINAENAGKSETLMGEGPPEPSAALLEAVQAEGTPLDFAGFEGTTMAHSAVRGGSTFNLEWLLKRAPNLLRAVDGHGRTLLHTAVEHRGVEIAQLLVQRAPDLLARRDSFSRTPAEVGAMVDGASGKLAHWLILAMHPAKRLVDELKEHIGQPDSGLLPGWVSPLASGLHRLLYEEFWERSLWLSAASSHERKEGRPSESNFRVENLVLTTHEANATRFEVLGLCALPLAETPTAVPAPLLQSTPSPGGYYRYDMAQSTVTGEGGGSASRSPGEGAGSGSAPGDGWMGSVSILVFWDVSVDKWAVETASNRITQLSHHGGNARAMMSADGCCTTCGAQVDEDHWQQHKLHCDRISIAHEDIARCEEEMISLHFQIEAKKTEILKQGRKLEENGRHRNGLVQRLQGYKSRRDPNPKKVEESELNLADFEERMLLDEHTNGAMQQQHAILYGRFMDAQRQIHKHRTDLVYRIRVVPAAEYFKENVRMQ